MHINDTVIYFDPLTANQPLDQSDTSASDTTAGDTGTQVGTATSTPADATGEVNTVGSILSLVVPLLLMGVVFYFFLIRPQRKKDKGTSIDIITWSFRAS